jgi:prepilin-type N-terminal cleavage/methylation domain-containing protein
MTTHARRSRSSRTAHAGFTLVELLLVVTVIGIVAAIAMPNIVRARGAAMEVATVGALRAVNTAQTSYAATCAAGRYAPSIVWLQTPSVPGGPTFIGPEFTSNVTDRYGYRIRFTAGPRANRSARTCNGLAVGRAVTGYFVGADVRVAQMGVSRYFGVHGGGVIYQSTRRIRPLFAGVPPAPAKSIQ